MGNNVRPTRPRQPTRYGDKLQRGQPARHMFGPLGPRVGQWARWVVPLLVRVVFGPPRIPDDHWPRRPPAEPQPEDPTTKPKQEGSPKKPQPAECPNTKPKSEGSTTKPKPEPAETGRQNGSAEDFPDVDD
uniref:Uncharacterized protein 10 n=1 Tax=Halisarca dujardinii TaxID=2583056 RepID=A0AA96MI23_HALDU|nr:uncharacterized protein 10 [Halisarca dujardinii]